MMSLAKDVGIAFLVFALAGALHAASVLPFEVKYIVHASFFPALIAYIIALMIQGGFVYRLLSIRMGSLAVAWVILGIGSALNLDGLWMVLFFIAAVMAARQVLPKHTENQ